MDRKGKKVIGFGGALIVLAGAYWVWCVTNRGNPTKAPITNIERWPEVGVNHGKGNLLAIGPWMSTTDYVSEESFRKKIDAYFAEANERGWLQTNTVVVLPEGLGVWLVAVDEKESVYKQDTLTKAVAIILASNPNRLPVTGSINKFVFSAKSRQMAEVYDRTLSRLAKKYRVHIVGGSVYLTNPTVKAGRLIARDGDLYSVCPFYHEDGNADSTLGKKVFLTKDEQGYASGGKVKDLPVYDTPAGRIGVLICADAWFPESYQQMDAKKADYIASPSYILSEEPQALDLKWDGYSGQRSPKDVDQQHVKRLTEQEALLLYGLNGRLAKCKAQIGVACYLRGDLWDQYSDGSSFVVGAGNDTHFHRRNCATMLNVWL